MPAPLSQAVRQRILADLQRGRTPASIARQHRLCPRTVRHLCQRFRRHGAAAVVPDYPGGETPLPSRAIEQALALHEQHPDWGAGYLRIQLRRLHPQLDALPSVRSLQRWMRRRRQPPAPPGRKPARAAPTASTPHAVWQMDAVEQLPLQTGQQVSWLRWVDQCTGAVLGTVVFPLQCLWSRAGARSARRGAEAISPLGPAHVLAGRQWRAVG